MYEDRVVGIGDHAGDERAVDLEFADRQTLEIAHRRVAGAEVVDRDLDAGVVQRGKGARARCGSWARVFSVISSLS